jgi:protein subunit release factor B
MGIATAIIDALTTVGTTIYSTVSQTSQLDKGQAEQRKMYYGDLSQRRKELAAQEKLARDTMAQNQENFEQTMSLQREQLNTTKNEYAHNAFREQSKKMTDLFSQNEQLKNLYLNRLSSLRN